MVIITIQTKRDYFNIVIVYDMKKFQFKYYVNKASYRCLYPVLLNFKALV